MAKSSLYFFSGTSLLAFAMGVVMSFVVNPHYQFDDGSFVLVPLQVLPDGAVYSGEFDEYGLMAGEGRLEWPDGSWYEGEFVHGQFEGVGKIAYASGLKYEGVFALGSPSGEGVMRDGFGGVYEGEMFNWLFEGKGRFRDDAGNVYEGEFHDNVFSGEGEIRFENGYVHKGHFEHWVLNGEGQIIDDYGNVLKGNFESGNLQGEGKRLSRHGSVIYEGEFADGYYHGQGTLFESAGYYKGEFEYGQKQGEGEYVYAKPVDGLASFTGTWRYDRLVSSDAFELPKADVIAEKALFEQEALLAEQIERLTVDEALNGDEAKKPRAFFIGVAGYGEEEVFRREVEKGLQVLGGHFEVESRSALLVNSRRDIHTYPMATKHALRQLLNEAGQVMHEDDVLVLLMTSHGSKTHEFAIDQKGIALSDLAKNELAAMLNQSGITRRILVISACYSGGFIEALKNRHTAILTAAAHDKTSFGCADDNALTYFGEAFFEVGFNPQPQADSPADIPEVVTLLGAFEKAQAWIDAKETAEGLTPSEPQVFVGDAMQALLEENNW